MAHLETRIDSFLQPDIEHNETETYILGHAKTSESTPVFFLLFPQAHQQAEVLARFRWGPAGLASS